MNVTTQQCSWLIANVDGLGLYLHGLGLVAWLCSDS